MSERPERPPEANHNSTADQGEAPRRWSLRAIADSIAFFALPGAVYIGACWLFGVLSHPEARWLHLSFGFGVTLVVMVLFILMGESLIEDVVKLIFAAPVFAVVWYIDVPPEKAAIIWAVALGVPSGAIMPLVFRAWNRLLDGPPRKRGPGRKTGGGRGPTDERRSHRKRRRRQKRDR